MKLLTIIGAVLVVVGAVWFTQGIGVLHGSPMTGESLWTFIGALVVLVGIGCITFAGGQRRATRRDEDEGSG